jgi:hypothetical protein
VVVNDLIIDEAAALTEPEMYIPFHYIPLRLLLGYTQFLRNFRNSNISRGYRVDGLQRQSDDLFDLLGTGLDSLVSDK